MAAIMLIGNLVRTSLGTYLTPLRPNICPTVSLPSEKTCWLTWAVTATHCRRYERNRFVSVPSCVATSAHRHPAVASGIDRASLMSHTKDSRTIRIVRSFFVSMLCADSGSPSLWLVVVCGGAGAGKSTYGQRVARHYRFAFVDIDACTDRLVNVGLSLAGRDPCDRDSAEFKLSYRVPIIDTLFDIAIEQLRVGLSVVLVAPLTAERKQPHRFVELLQRRLAVVCVDVAVRCAVVIVQCDASTRIQRIRSRELSRDAHKFFDEQGYLDASEVNEDGAVCKTLTEASVLDSTAACHAAFVLNTTVDAEPSVNGPWSSS